MPTTSQIKTIQLGKKLLDLTEPQYRMLLQNVAGVDSCTKLDNVGVENVMAVLEDMGFDSHPAGKTYWRNKVSARGTFANARFVHKIRELAGHQRYELSAMVLRFSGNRTELPEQLRPQEAWQLIEMLKSAGAREAKSHGA